ncbi:DUF1707 and DUF4190 domain-containing protein [Streptomyces sp. NBC_00414]|uniref:DUF1707 and DUF4190 domain-containing protein n=1 Tax=Streptomyces sp. NBC_00414 TaxID=2975739 RepID=UPI002E21BD54
MSYPSPWQPGQGRNQPRPWQEPPGHSMLASTADRERAVDVLRAGFGEGRMQQPEFEKRVARAYAARTVGELALLVADLPQGPVPLPAASGPVPRTFLPVAVAPKTNEKAVGAAICGVLCLVTVGLTGIPAVILGHTARSEMRHTGEGGEGLALTGLVFGWLSTVGWALVMTLLFVVVATS